MDRGEELQKALQVSPLGKSTTNHTTLSPMGTPRNTVAANMSTLDSPATPFSAKQLVQPNFRVFVQQQKPQKNDQKLIAQIVKQYNKSVGKQEIRKNHRIAPPLQTKQNYIGSTKSPNTKWREEHPQEIIDEVQEEHQLRKKNEDMEVFIIRKMQQEKQEHLLKKIQDRFKLSTAGPSYNRNNSLSPMKSSRKSESPEIKPTLEYHTLATRASTSKSSKSNLPTIHKGSEVSVDQKSYFEEIQKPSEEVFTVNGKQNDKIELPSQQPSKLPNVKNIRKYSRGNHSARDSRKDSYTIRMDDDLTLDLEMLKDLNKFSDKIPWDVQPAIELLQYKRLIMGGSNYTNFRPSNYLPLGLRAYSLKLKLKQQDTSHIPTFLPEKTITSPPYQREQEEDMQFIESAPEELRILQVKTTPRLYNAPSPKLVRRNRTGSKTNPKR